MRKSFGVLFWDKKKNEKFVIYTQVFKYRLTLSLKTIARYILKSNWSAKDSRFRRSCERKRLSVADFLEAGSAIWYLILVLKFSQLYNERKLKIMVEYVKNKPQVSWYCSSAVDNSLAVFPRKPKTFRPKVLKGYFIQSKGFIFGILMVLAAPWFPKIHEKFCCFPFSLLQ